MNIFDEIDEKDLKLLTECLKAVKKTYKKNEIIYDIDDRVTAVAYIFEGRVELSKDDYNSNKVIIGHLTKGQTFAESMVCAEVEKSLICAKALEDTSILFLNFKRIISTCSNNCPFHKKLIKNLIILIAHKNLMLQERIQLLSKKSLKERIMCMLYKEIQSSIAFSAPPPRVVRGSPFHTPLQIFAHVPNRENFSDKEEHNVEEKIFTIPYSREQMAEFIGADRSALSRELSNMKKQGLIDYYKNTFKIIQQNN